MSLRDVHELARWVWICKEKETPNATLKRSVIEFEALATTYIKTGEFLAKRKPNMKAKTKSKFEFLKGFNDDCEVSVDLESSKLFKKDAMLSPSLDTEQQINEQREATLKAKEEAKAKKTAARKEQSRICMQKLREQKRQGEKKFIDASTQCETLDS